MSSSKIKRVSVADICAKKSKGEKITMLTAYDTPMAVILDSAGIDIVLVGDSVGTAELGYQSTIPMTIDDMLHHVKAVRRGVNRALLVVDMPFMSYQISVEEALRNAGRLIQEGGADAVKIEGGLSIEPTVRRIVDAGIPVVGHAGLRPQYAKLTGMKVQGRTEAAADQILKDAKAFEDAGAFAVVLELVPRLLAHEITQAIGIPTIGIGSGSACDGQVLVTADLIGLQLGGPSFKHVKRYADAAKLILDAVSAYKADVEAVQFPGDEHGFE